MTIPCFFKLPQQLALLTLPLWVAAAHAQPVPAVPASAGNAPAAVAPPVAFQSALEGYKPYTDEKIVNWKEANDAVARIGGWRAYAKEASRTEAEPPAPAGNRGAKP